MPRAHQRTDGRFEHRYNDVTGKRRSVYGRTRKEADEKLRAALNQRDAGKLPAHATITVDQFFDLYLDDMVRPHNAPSTYRNRRSGLATLRPALGSTKLAALRPYHIQHAYTDLRGRLSPNTVAAIHAMLRAALKTAIAWDLLPANPTDAVRPPSKEARDINPLTLEEAQALLDATEHQPTHLLWRTLLQTGLRIGEAGALDWAHTNTDRKEIQVAHSLNLDHDGTWRFGPPKTKASRRSITLTPDLADQLRHHHADQLAGRSPSNQHGTVFTTTHGAPLDRYIAYHALQRDCLRAGLEPRSPHELRHTCATLLFQRDTHPKVVQTLLGHASIRETIDTYSHYIRGLDDKAAATMADLFSGQDPVNPSVTDLPTPLKTPG